MARLILAAALAAALAHLAAGAHYGDYSSGNMPNYGVAADYEGPRDSNAADEYHDQHPQDVSMALDYNKFAEDPIGSYKSKSKEATDRELEEMDIWQKPEKQEPKISRSQDTHNNRENFEKYHTTENVPNFGINKRIPKGTFRHKTRSVDDVEDRIQNQDDKYNFRGIKDVEGYSHLKSQEDTHGDKMNEFKGRTRFRNKESFFRAKARRKPRDKIDKDIFDDPPPMDENELALFKKFVKENKKDIDYPIDLPGMDLSNLPKKDIDYPVDMPGIDLPTRLPAMTHDDIKKVKTNKPQSYHGDYDEYYDMKRVNSIKEKLPGLLQRNKGDGAEMMKDVQFPSTELVSDDILWANRRMVPDPETPPPTRVTTSSTTSSVTISKTVTTTDASTTVTEKASTLSKDELSLAEKSRLSILKKAQRKESFGNASSTSKPPVLLQVANKAQTLVMVEPPTSPDPLFRAREIPEDSPERLSLVKRMMRHKLVAGARSIRELTDNWDEMVCDYVDMSLLENSATFKYISAVWLCVTIILMVLMVET